MTVRKYAIEIFYHLDAVDYMCCERIVTYSELRRIVDTIEEALCLNIRVEYRVRPLYVEGEDD